MDMASNDQLAMQQSQCLLLTMLKFNDCHDLDAKPFYHHKKGSKLEMLASHVMSKYRIFGLIIFNEIVFW